MPTVIFLIVAFAVNGCGVDEAAKHGPENVEADVIRIAAVTQRSDVPQKITPVLPEHPVERVERKQQQINRKLDRLEREIERLIEKRRKDKPRVKKSSMGKRDQLGGPDCRGSSSDRCELRITAESGSDRLDP